MPERMTPEGRKALMSRIRSKDTRPEMLVRRLLHGLGYRYRLHDSRLPGKPDLVFPGRRKIIFVHGCYWHGHDCGRGFKPRTNIDFWTAKLAGNQERDKANLQTLQEQGWKVLTVWECELKPAGMDALQRRLESFLNDCTAT